MFVFFISYFLANRKDREDDIKKSYMKSEYYDKFQSFLVKFHKEKFQISYNFFKLYFYLVKVNNLLKFRIYILLFLYFLFMILIIIEQ